MNEERNGYFYSSVTRVFKAWKLTILIPVILMVVSGVSGRYFYSKNEVYTASASFVIASNSYKDKGISETQARATDQMNFENMISTYRGLLTNDAVLKNVINQIDGTGRYNPRYLAYAIIPTIRKSIFVSTTASDSVIFNVQVTHKNADKAAKIANSIIKYSKKEEKNIWGRSSIKVLSSAQIPLKPNSRNMAVLKIMIFVLILSFLLSSLLVSIREAR